MGADGSPYAHSFAANGSALEAPGGCGGALADAGAAFVLESKGTWWHAGFHLTTAIVGPTILTLPYAFRGLGWGLGLASLTTVGAVTFYAYVLMSRVLDHCEKQGRRHIRFRELAADVLGRVQKWVRLDILPRSLLSGGHQHWNKHRMHLAFRGMPQGRFNSFSAMELLGFISFCLYLLRCYSKNAPAKDYSLDSTSIHRTYNAFTSISILASLYGNGILPEIQATLAPPATGKMVKGLVLCYMVAVLAFYSAAVSGYWAFGNKVSSNVLNSLLPDSGPSLAPIWLLGLGVVFVLLQLFAIGLVYSQVAFEIMEKNSADTRQSRFSKRNLVPRLILRTLYMVFCAFMAAMLPFFGDIVAVVGELHSS
ncbi:hypothetical protein ZIOFF_014671 [Zingiber officinale]|uniref:Amino acid transporter transmembrane domain-containing protein n=1 Tax=Zingiber officinale TaxID=94328 RepID=A0A8J5HWQ9_ZINOF|nr:hypothetical protein ZIOFF_014671 [Zingiber officinale]